MRTTFFALALVCTFGLSTAKAGDAPPSAATGLTPDQEALVRQQLSGLAKAMGVEVVAAADQAPAAQAPAPAAQPAPAPAPPKKTMADVADKALDMATGFVTQISASMQKVAPEVWRIMIMQQYAKAIGDLVLPLGLVLMVIIYAFVARKKWKLAEDQNNDWKDSEHNWHFAVTACLPLVLGAIFAICTVVALSDSIKYLVNPEYYAVKDLLTMLLNRGQSP